MSIKTLLIGLDGATWTLLDPLMEQGVMPFLKSFLATGVRAPLRTIIPPLTPPAWTSLMTGQRPGRHGVFDFFRMDSAEDKHIRFFNSNDVGVDTIWSLASAQGQRVTTLNFPAMFPPPHLNGYVVPGWVPWRQLRLACWPEDLLDKLKTIPGFNQRELAMDIKLEEKAIEGVASYNEYGPWIDLHSRREANLFDILAYLTKEDPSELTSILFDGVDKLQHLCWRYLCPQDATPLETPEELHLRELALDYYRKLDRVLEQMVEMAGPEATVLMASDHGFGPTWEVFHLNTWLEQNGYLAWSEAALKRDSSDAPLGVGQVAKHTWLLDWSKTKAYATTPTSNGIHIVMESGDKPGVKPEEYEAFRAKLIADLRTVKDPESGEQIVSEIYTREEAFPGPQGKYGPDLTLVLRDGGLISILPAPHALEKRATVAGSHRHVGVFMAKGPGVKKGFAANELSLLDVAPTTLYSLGLPVPKDMEGKVPPSIFEPKHMAVRPVKIATQQVAAAPVAPVGEASMTEEDEAVVMERLRELGYID
ncbi:MAG: alkaline phosphatase family protein [Bryobacteraceae bacterium]